jgi:hypothetical protein
LVGIRFDLVLTQLYGLIWFESALDLVWIWVMIWLLSDLVQIWFRLVVFGFGLELIRIQLTFDLNQTWFGFPQTPSSGFGLELVQLWFGLGLDLVSVCV